MDLQKLSAHELLRLCLQSKGQAHWVEFVRRFQPVIAKIVVKSVRRWTAPVPALVDDLVQDIYLKLCANNFRALREFDCQHENALFGFLKVVASSVVQDHFRSSYSQKRGSGKEDEELDQAQTAVAASTNFAEEAERRILLDEIAKCLESQAYDPNFDRDMTIFWLYYRQGLTAKAISELPATGLTVKGVESTLLRLTRMMRERINEKPAREITSGQRIASGRSAVSGTS